MVGRSSGLIIMSVRSRFVLQCAFACPDLPPCAAPSALGLAAAAVPPALRCLSRSVSDLAARLAPLYTCSGPCPPLLFGSAPSSSCTPLGITPIPPRPVTESLRALSLRSCAVWALRFSDRLSAEFAPWFVPSLGVSPVVIGVRVSGSLSRSTGSPTGGSPGSGHTR